MFAFALFLSLLFVSQFGTMSAAVFVLLVPAYMLVRRRDILAATASKALLLVLPVLALASIAWSEARGVTAKYAIELTLTLLAAFLLSSAREQEAILEGMAAAFLVYVGVALVAGKSVAVGVGSGGEAFSGLTDSKNLIADIAATGIMITSVLAVVALRKRDLFWIAIAVVGLLVEGRVLLAARSAGAVVGLAIGLGALAAMMPLLVLPPAMRAIVTALASLVLLVAAASYRAIASAVIAGGSAMFNKDPTLTGRTYLWYRAHDLIREKPMLGRGYSAFWQQGNIDAEGLWRYAGITGRSGFSFHNSAIQILVELGWFGLVVVCAVVLISTLALAFRVIRRPTPMLCFWMAILLYELCRAPIEAVGVAPLYYSSMIVFTALAAAFGSEPAGSSRPGRRSHPTPPRIYPTGPGAHRLRAAKPPETP